MPTVNLGRVRPIYKGAYAAGTAYTPLDMVQYQGNMYQCIANSTGNLPTSTAHFVAVVDVATWSSTLPSPGKIPLAEANGRLNEAWLQRKPDIKPSISVDWTLKPTAASLIAAGWTITRASEMTYFGAAPVKVAENLLIESRTFGAAWNKTTDPVTLTAVTHASGLQGFNVAGTAAAAGHDLFRPLSEGAYLPSQTYRLRFLVKSGAYTKCVIADQALGRAGAQFDLSGSGATIGAGLGAGYVSHNIVAHELGGGLFWCTLVLTSAASGAWSPAIGGYPDSGATVTAAGASYTGDGTSGIEVYAAQLQHNFDGHFVETTTVPVTLYASPLLTAPANELAYQHNANGECTGLLSYPSATNLCLQSQNLEHASWLGAGVSVSVTKRMWANAAPFYRLSKTDSMAARERGQACFTPSAGSTFSATIALMGDYWSGTTSAEVGLDGVENGAWGVGADSTFSIISGPGSASKVGAGTRVLITGLSFSQPTLVRVTRTYPLAESTARRVSIFPGSSSATTIGAAILATRVQVEAGPRATPYIPTTTAAVTRAAQVTTLGGSAFAAASNPTQGTLLVRASVEDETFAGLHRIALTTTNTVAGTPNRLFIAHSDNSNQLFTYTVDRNVPQATQFLPAAWGTSPGAAAYAFRENSFQPAVNGAVGTLDTAGTLPAVGQFSVGSNGNWAGLIQRTELFPRAMTAAELTAITTPGVLA